MELCDKTPESYALSTDHHVACHLHSEHDDQGDLNAVSSSGDVANGQSISAGEGVTNCEQSSILLKANYADRFPAVARTDVSLFLFRLMPGDISDILLYQGADPDTVAEFEESWV